MLIRQTELDLV